MRVYLFGVSAKPSDFGYNFKKGFALWCLQFNHKTWRGRLKLWLGRKPVYGRKWIEWETWTIEELVRSAKQREHENYMRTIRVDLNHGT